MKNKKEKIIAILLVVGLIVATGSISYAAFRFSQTGSKVNTITTGAITMSYTESSNVLSMSGALPTTDTTGKGRLNPGEYFDFTVSSSITGDTNINYEIAVEELSGSTMDGDFIKFYLTKLGTDGSEQGIFGPSTYSVETEANTYTGRPANMMSLYTSSMTASETTTYRLRMYVSEEYNPQGDGGNLVYKARVNVYGLAGEKNEDGSVSSTLEENDWETIQKVVQAGKVAEAGWSVGDTKEVEINGQTKTATIIGLDHDGENTATFMVMSNIEDNIMNPMDWDSGLGTNEGGWGASQMRAWLNGDIYNSMSNKDYIKEVTKMTNNVGQYGNTVTGTLDKLFLLSVAEVGLSSGSCVVGEGTTYEWFTNNSSDGWFWLRSLSSERSDYFMGYSNGRVYGDFCYNPVPVFPAFVIG